MPKKLERIWTSVQNAVDLHAHDVAHALLNKGMNEQEASNLGPDLVAGAMSPDDKSAFARTLTPDLVNAQIELCDQESWAPAPLAVKQLGESGELKTAKANLVDELTKGAQEKVRHLHAVHAQCA